ncbi:MAG: TetR/AcrR family transcriptional regulator [Burkholderiaceae bacterium]
MEDAPSRKQITHQRIVDTAARAIRRGGFHGVGVAGIMKEAGLTHGGFYAHFASRDALLCEALERAGEESAARVTRNLNARAGAAHPFRRFVESYLADALLAAPEAGCPVAALASEMPRQASEVREAAARRVRGLVALVAGLLPATHAHEAGVIASQLVGALQMARALGNNAEGRALLAATRAAVVARIGTAPGHARPDAGR